MKKLIACIFFAALICVPQKQAEAANLVEYALLQALIAHIAGQGLQQIQCDFARNHAVTASATRSKALGVWTKCYIRGGSCNDEMNLYNYATESKQQAEILEALWCQ